MRSLAVFLFLTAPALPTKACTTIPTASSSAGLSLLS